MSASAFHVYFSIRLLVDAANSVAIDTLELRQHPWQVAAKKHGLDSRWGATIDENQYYLMVGFLVGHFGWESEAYAQLSDTVAQGITTLTTQRLQDAGFEQPPNWHFQFEPN